MPLDTMLVYNCDISRLAKYINLYKSRKGWQSYHENKNYVMINATQNTIIVEVLFPDRWEELAIIIDYILRTYTTVVVVTPLKKVPFNIRCRIKRFIDIKEEELINLFATLSNASPANSRIQSRT